MWCNVSPIHYTIFLSIASANIWCSCLSFYIRFNVRATNRMSLQIYIVCGSHIPHLMSQQQRSPVHRGSAIAVGNIKRREMWNIWERMDGVASMRTANNRMYIVSTSLPLSPSQAQRHKQRNQKNREKREWRSQESERRKIKRKNCSNSKIVLDINKLHFVCAWNTHTHHDHTHVRHARRAPPVSIVCCHTVFTRCWSPLWKCNVERVWHYIHVGTIKW